MYIVLLRFSRNKNQASQYMDAHRAWIKRGFDDEVFLLAGSLQPESGGAILAAKTSRDELEKRVATDPFVEADVVSAEILEIDPAKADERLAFLVEN